MAVALLAATAAWAQKLPPPSRTVFRCDVDGKVVYTDAPCLGAKRVDIEPTRGLNKSTGSQEIGPDVRMERNNEAVADALRPLFGESVEQRLKRHHRARPTADVRGQCDHLEAEIAQAERAEARAKPGQLTEVQTQLLDLRTHYRDVGC